MRRRAHAHALAVALLLRAAPALAQQGALPVLDDWRGVGAAEPVESPSPKGVLSPRAAGALVAALEGVRASSPQPWLEREGLVKDLLKVFRPGAELDGVPPEVLARQLEQVRRVTVLGHRAVGGRRLLVVEANVLYSEPGGGFMPARLGILLDADGSPTDAVTLSWSAGDACGSAGRTAALRDGTILLTEATRLEGRLCAPGDPAIGDCCSWAEGQVFEVSPGPGARLREAGRRRINLSGQWRDPATGERIFIEDDDGRSPRVGYRSARVSEWKRLEVKSFDRARRTVDVKFPSGPIRYRLTLDPVGGEGSKLVSVGSDGSKAQAFGWLDWPERLD
jgi:hypothetical protein